MKLSNTITLKHLQINELPMIGLQFGDIKEIQELVKELPGVRWSKRHKIVIVPNNKSNIKLIFNKFRGIAWIEGNDFFNSKSKLSHENENSVVIATSKAQFKIFIRLPANKKSKWVDYIKNFSQSYFITRYNLWAIKGGNENYLKIKKYFSDEGCTIIIKKQEKRAIDMTPQKWYYNKPIDNEVLKEYCNTLTIKRASNSTKKTYTSMFKWFLAYFYGKEITHVTTKEITDYLLWEIEKNGISPTQQNQLINAIKYYFEKVLNQPRTVYNLPRAK
ncbi:MAG: phage integrase N-terminal SAM-like domain-containing protein, partial [Bacteroidales bacterium]|nr:phage integrase N-terminal SAM-like domain-containing protein [Bacteroidales bacterium]